jgi:hypothetical protein
VSGENFNGAIRRAAGRERPASEPIEPVEGTIGIGIGGAAAPRKRAQSTSEINAAIRLAARRAQNRVDLDDVSLDDLLGGS